MLGVGDARADASLPSQGDVPAEERLEVVDHDARALNEVSIAASVSTYGGTRLAGTGSVGRYRLGSGAIELDVERFFDTLGIGVHVGAFPAAGGGTTVQPLYVRIEGSAGIRLATWRGPYPGGVGVFAGLGGDLSPAWFAEDFRFYPTLRAKGRVWLSREVPLQLGYTALPAALAGEGLRMHEHRL